MGKVLVACEESQEVCKAFRARGHEAYSCDLIEPSGGHPEWHILGDAVKNLEGGRIVTMDGVEHEVGKWDLLIAHPPCTYLSNAGATFLWRNHELQADRLSLEFRAGPFMRFWWADIPRICIENPVPSKVSACRKEARSCSLTSTDIHIQKERTYGLKDCRSFSRRALLSRRNRGCNRGRTSTIRTAPKIEPRHFPELQRLCPSNGAICFKEMEK